MEIKAYPNGIYGATTYLVSDESSKEAILIDCTSSVDEIEKEIKNKKLNLKYILITHGHFDHCYCLSKMKEKFPLSQILIHKDDVSLLDRIDIQCQMADIPAITLPCVDGLIDENTKNLKLGEYDIKIIHTKGHSKGGVCYLINNILFSGDTLFKDSIGRYDLFGGNYAEIISSIKDKLFTLNDNIKVFPGHGEATTIGYEKKYNPYFQ